MAFWIPLIMAGMSVAQGMKQQGEAEIAKLTDESNTRVANIIREGNNKLAAAQGSLARYMQSRANQVHLKNTGKAIEAVTTNMLRLRDVASTGALDRRVAAAEELGAVQAQAGAAGIGGGTVAMINSTVNLRHAQVDQIAKRQEKEQTYDMSIQRDSLKEQMILGLSDVQYLDNINMMEQQSRNIQVPSTGQVFANAALTFMQSYAQLGGGAKSATPAMQGQAKPLFNNPAFVRNM